MQSSVRAYCLAESVKRCNLLLWRRSRKRKATVWCLFVCLSVSCSASMRPAYVSSLGRRAVSYTCCMLMMMILLLLLLLLLLVFVSIYHRHRLRSASTKQVDVPFLRQSMVGGHAFPLAGAKVGNSLPADVAHCWSLPVFKNRLKTWACFSSPLQWHSLTFPRL